MRILMVLSLILTLDLPAFAQQPPQPKPSETAWQINNVVNDWARQLEGYQQAMTQLQVQLAAVTKERDELKAKLEATPAK